MGSNCIFKTQKTGKKHILNILEQHRESFNFEKKKTQKFTKSAEISAESFFQDDIGCRQ